MGCMYYEVGSIPIQIMTSPYKREKNTRDRKTGISHFVPRLTPLLSYASPNGKAMSTLRRDLRKMQAAGVIFYDSSGDLVNLDTAPLTKLEWLRVSNIVAKTPAGNFEISLDFTPARG